MRLYHWARCSTCRQARELLRARHVDVEERDFFDERLRRDELNDLVRQAGGVRPLVSTASPTFARQGRALEDYSDGELEALVLSEPRLLRRPLLVTDDGRVLSGRKAIEREIGA